jgi:hypothetical protein
MAHPYPARSTRICWVRLGLPFGARRPIDRHEFRHGRAFEKS